MCKSEHLGTCILDQWSEIHIDRFNLHCKIINTTLCTTTSSSSPQPYNDSFTSPTLQPLLLLTHLTTTASSHPTLQPHLLLPQPYYHSYFWPNLKTTASSSPLYNHNLFSTKPYNHSLFSPTLQPRPLLTQPYN